MLLDLPTLLITSSASLFICRRTALNTGLVDTPDNRKVHEGSVPLVGGISILLALALFILFNPTIIPNSFLFVFCISILCTIGVVDDKFDLCFKIRLLAQISIALVMIYFADLRLYHLGDAFGFGTVIWENEFFSCLLTVLAIVGAINAFNMVDGIDGLLGGLTIVSLGAIAYILKLDNHTVLAYFCLLIIITFIPYLCLNLGLLGKERKVFMGDAGSTFIGFSIIWILLSASQNANAPLIRPVTCLWLIAIPLMDMAAIMIRRIQRGDSPFKPDREHLHHIIQRLGFDSRQTLLIICSLAVFLASFGIYGEIAKISEYTMFYLFCGLFILYTLTLTYVWKISGFLEMKKRATEKV